MIHRVTRLSDLVVQNLSPSRVLEVVDTITQVEDLEGRAQQTSFVYSGVALGVESVEMYLAQERPRTIQLLKGLVDRINALIEESGNMETTNTLVELRAPLAEKLNELIAMNVGGCLAEFVRSYGIPEDVINSDKPAEKMAVREMIAIGADFFRRAPTVIFGYHYAKKSGAILKMECTCPSCMARLFHAHDVTPDAAMRDLVLNCPSMDAVFYDFAVAAVKALQGKLLEAKSGAEIEHEIDVQGAAQLANTAITRMLRAQHEGDM